MLENHLRKSTTIHTRKGFQLRTPILHDFAFLIHWPTVPDIFFGMLTTTPVCLMLVCKMVMQKLVINKMIRERERGAKENHKSFSGEVSQIRNIKINYQIFSHKHTQNTKELNTVLTTNLTSNVYFVTRNCWRWIQSFAQSCRKVWKSLLQMAMR